MTSRAHPVRLAALAALGAATLLLTGCGSLRLPGLGEPAPPAPSTAPSIAAPVAAKPVPPKPVPDAVPRVEAIPQGHPNVPYEDRGETYEPERSDVPMVETGVASWYGKPFHGRRTASGERYDMHAMTAAHRTMPLPSYAKVRNLANGKEVIVRVNDRGPFRDGRVIDLSRAAARKLGFSGLAQVEVRRLTNDEIRTGAWKRAGPTVAQAPDRLSVPGAALVRYDSARPEGAVSASR
jgi:rare lipoprotein A